MLNIAICDDESVAVSIVKGILEDSLRERGLTATILSYTDSEALFSAIHSGAHYDLLLLDIDMPKIDGIRLGTQLYEWMRDTLLIYISNHENRVFDSFRARPFRFIRKCDLHTEWPQVMQAALEELRRRESGRLTFKSGTVTVYLRPEEILYVESFKKKQLIHTDQREIELTSTFSAVLEQLCGLGFIQIHKSYMVNFRYIHSIDRTEVELDDHTRLPIGRSRLQMVQQEFQRLVMGRL